MQNAPVSRAAIQALAIWLGVLLPIVTLIQLSFVGNHLAKLPPWVMAAFAIGMVGMITYALWAAIGLWQVRPGAAETAHGALVASFAANMLCCAPLSILMSAPPTCVPAMLVTLLGLALIDTWQLENAPAQSA